MQQKIHLTIEELRDIQADLMCDDLPLADHMLHWTAAQAQAYFESGGFEIPEVLSDEATPDEAVSQAPGVVADGDSPPPREMVATTQVVPAVPVVPLPCAPNEPVTARQRALPLPAEVAEAMADALAGACGATPAAVTTGLGEIAGLRPNEWANCALLQPLLAALLPDEELDAHNVVLLEIATTELLKLGDADQQCEALLDGPQCRGMHERLARAELVLALVNDNEEATTAGGGAHWSALACRRSNWREGVFVVEHYDSSGDVEVNADAAGLVGWSLAERCSEVCGMPADRIEVWRMVAPLQHDASSCGLTAVSYLYHLYAAYLSSYQEPPKPRGA
jgi:hypothetical protein